jgi:hypothetical protein
MSSNDNSQQAKGVNDSRGVSINNVSNEAQTNQKRDEPIILASQQQPFYHQGAHQQYTMYPSGVTYSIDPSQVPGAAGLDYAMVPTQQIYQFPVYYSSETFHHQPPPQQFEDHYQTSPSAVAAQQQFPPPAQGGPSTQYHQIQTAHYSGTPNEQQQQQQSYMQHENSQVYQKANATMFDNTAAKYTADWVSRTTLIPSEMKVPPELPGEVITHNSRVIEPKNWGEGSYVVTTTQSKLPVASGAVDQAPLDQQLAQLNITSFPFVSTQLSQAPQPQQLSSGGYTYNWPGTSQQQQHQQYRDQTTRAYSATALPKSQSSTWADVIKKNNNNNKGSMQHHPHSQRGMNYQDQRGTQSAQPTYHQQQQQSQIRYEKSFAGPKNTFNQIGANNGGGFVRNVNRSSFGNRGNNSNNMIRPNSIRQNSRPQNNFSGQQQQQRGPLPSLLAQHRTQNFPRSNFGGGQRPQGNHGYGGYNSGGHNQQQMPEFNPGVPPPSLPNQQYRQPMPPSMMPPPPPFPPPPFNMMNPQQQQQFFRAFFSQVRPDAMMPQPPQGPYGQFGQRYFNPGVPFGYGPPSFGQQFNRHPNFNRGQRRGRGSRFQQPRRNYQEQPRFQPDRQMSSNQDSKPLDPELADSVNRGVDFDRDETKTPEPKGDTETTGSPNEDKKLEDDASPTPAET